MYLICLKLLNSDKKHFCFAIKMYTVDSGVFNLFPVGGRNLTPSYTITNSGALARATFKLL